MLSFPAAIKVYPCTVACDMQRSFDGLSMMAEHIIRRNPFSGHLLVFCNSRKRHFEAACGGSADLVGCHSLSCTTQVFFDQFVTVLCEIQ